MAQEISMQRPRDTELVVNPHLAQWAIRVIVIILAVFAVAVGVAILVGGPERFSGVSYRVAINLPGAPASWGITILVAGVLTTMGVVTGHPLWASFGMLTAGFWCLLFAGAFLLATLQFPGANSTAMWMYTCAGAVCMTISGVYGATWLANRKA